MNEMKKNYARSTKSVEEKYLISISKVNNGQGESGGQEGEHVDKRFAKKCAQNQRLVQ